MVADTATLGQCGDSKLGEIWVASNHNSQGYHHLTNQDKSTLNQHFNVCLLFYILNFQIKNLV